MKSATRKTKRLENITDMEAAYTLSQALAEASRCLLCHDPPCSRSCPAVTDPGRFIWKLRMKNLKGAIRTIKENNILGGICGVACPTDQLCQEACSATEIDRPIEIGRLQRFLVEHGWRIGFEPVARGPGRSARVAIVGSGPAGLACAAELARAGVKATIFEARPRPGGVLRYGVPMFRLSEEFLERELDDLRRLGVTIKCDSRIQAGGVDRLLERGFCAVFVATGIWRPHRLAIPGAELKNVTTATELLEAVRRGGRAAVSRMVRDKNVAIIGGGSVAMDVASTCRGLGARKVYCICLEGLAEIPADRADLEMARDNLVIIKPQCQVSEILGKGGRVTGVRGHETEWIEPGSFVPSNARAVPNTSFQLSVQAVVMAIGAGPEPENSKLSPAMRQKRSGLIHTRKDGVSTSVKGVYAGGDITRGPSLIVHAVADGKQAASKILRSISQQRAAEGNNG